MATVNYGGLFTRSFPTRGSGGRVTISYTFSLRYVGHCLIPAFHPFGITQKKAISRTSKPRSSVNMAFKNFKLARYKLNLLQDLLYRSEGSKSALREVKKWVKRNPYNTELLVSPCFVNTRLHRTEDNGKR